MSAERGVILAAHGAGDGSDANRATAALARAVAKRTGRPTLPAFVLGTPTLGDAVARLGARVVTAIPLLTGAGWFARRLPEALGCGAPTGVTVDVLRPVGAHPRLREALVERALAALDALRGDATVLVVGHGTRRCAASGQATAELSAAIAAGRPGAVVRSAYLDQTPRLEDVVATLGAGDVIVVPLLMGGGPHAQQDIGERLGANGPAAARGRLRVVTPLGGDAALLESVVLEMLEAPARPRSKRAPTTSPLRIGTRGSRLALWQARLVARRLAELGVPTRLVTIDTAGDREARRPLDAFEAAGPFTDELEVALRDDAIDLAVHSLKDLPLEPPADLEIAAVLARCPVGEALVARGDLSLAKLPPGAVVGTSSRRRAAQLVLLRPDLRTAPIRGAVEHRVRQVQQGAFDATILALAGLLRIGLETHVSELLPTEAIMPAAGQATIVVQVRRDDERARRATRPLGHAPTTRAVAAELAFARAVEARQGWIAAAVARDEGDGTLRLWARAIEPDGTTVHDVARTGTDPARLGADAAGAALAAGPSVDPSLGRRSDDDGARPTRPWHPESDDRQPVREQCGREHPCTCREVGPVGSSRTGVPGARRSVPRTEEVRS